MDRLIARSTSLSECEAARKRIERELEALAIAEDEGRSEDVYHHLVTIGTCLGVLNKPRESLEYFKRAVDEFPDRRLPLWVVIMTLSHLGDEDELVKYTKLYEERFPPRDRTR